MPKTKPTSIRDLVLSQCADLKRSRQKPRQVIFSSEGFALARSQETHDNPLFDKDARMYMGLNFTIDSTLLEEQYVEVTPETQSPVSVEAPAAVAARLVVDDLDVADAGDMPRQTLVVDIAGQHLTAEKLCDIISAWVGANPDTPLSTALENVVREHGTFE